MNASHAATGAPTDILGLVTSTSPWSPAAHAAAGLAASFGARLTGCYIDPSLRMLHGGEAEPSVLALLLDTPEDNPDDRDAFAAFARKAGVPQARWLTTRAGIAATTRRLGAWHDLIVLERDIVEGDSALDVLGEALLCCRTPCMLLPPGWNGIPRFERLAIAWNGGIESVRAIHAALPFARTAEDVLVIDGEPSAADDEGDRTPPFDPLAYLADHRVHAHSRRVAAAPHESGAAILREATSIGADLLVMGAYGHSRTRERMFGGATRHILRHAGIPVLMEH